jgi:hypothetical protein
MIVSKDYDALIEQALAMNDKEWFEELVGKKKELQAAEEEVRKDIGLID